MRAVPAALAAHLDGQATTVARGLRLTRADGVVMGFTDHDAPLSFAGTVFEAASGLSAGEAEATLGLGSGTQEIEGALSSAAIEEADILAGRYDGAKVESFIVNWQAQEQHLLLDITEIGEVKRGGSAFAAELRAITSQLDRLRGRLYRRRCDAVLGDRRCGVDLGVAGRFADVSFVRMAGSAVVVSGLTVPTLALFAGGHLTWTDGSAAGLSAEIVGLHPGIGGEVRVETIGAARFAPMPGDRLRLHVGCDKSFAACRQRFANGLNFQGFPHLPGTDAAMGFAKSNGLHNGGPVVP